MAKKSNLRGHYREVQKALLKAKLEAAFRIKEDKARVKAINALLQNPLPQGNKK